MTYADGRDMFTPEETLRNPRTVLSAGERLHRLLDEYPQLEKPPSMQPGNVRNASHFQPVSRATIGRHEQSGTRRTPGSVTARLECAVAGAMRSDMKSMRASCGNAACPACRKPEDQQPDERPIFFQDAIYWWNACRGKCMASECRRPLCFYIPRGHPSLNGWTLQRDDNTINHVPSNMIGVLCRQCNSSIPNTACISDRTGQQL